MLKISGYVVVRFSSYRNEREHIQTSQILSDDVVDSSVFHHVIVWNYIGVFHGHRGGDAGAQNLRGIFVVFEDEIEEGFVSREDASQDDEVPCGERPEGLIEVRFILAEVSGDQVCISEEFSDIILGFRFIVR